MAEKTVLLRIKSTQESRPFEAEHAKRLLAFPNPQWEEVADSSEKTGTAAKTTPKPQRKAAAKKAATTPLPEVDTTGQPTSI